MALWATPGANKPQPPQDGGHTSDISPSLGELLDKASHITVVCKGPGFCGLCDKAVKTGHGQQCKVCGLLFHDACNHHMGAALCPYRIKSALPIIGNHQGDPFLSCLFPGRVFQRFSADGGIAYCKKEHEFVEKSYKEAIVCSLCARPFKGILIRNTFRCTGCGFHAHKNCVSSVKPHCPGEFACSDFARVTLGSPVTTPYTSPNSSQSKPVFSNLAPAAEARSLAFQNGHTAGVVASGVPDIAPISRRTSEDAKPGFVHSASQESGMSQNSNSTAVLTSAVLETPPLTANLEPRPNEMGLLSVESPIQNTVISPGNYYINQSRFEPPRRAPPPVPLRQESMRVSRREEMEERIKRSVSEPNMGNMDAEGEEWNGEPRLNDSSPGGAFTTNNHGIIHENVIFSPIAPPPPVPVKDYTPTPSPRYQTRQVQFTLLDSETGSAQAEENPVIMKPIFSMKNLLALAPVPDYGGIEDVIEGEEENEWEIELMQLATVGLVDVYKNCELLAMYQGDVAAVVAAISG